MALGPVRECLVASPPRRDGRAARSRHIRRPPANGTDTHTQLGGGTWPEGGAGVGASSPRAPLFRRLREPAAVAAYLAD